MAKVKKKTGRPCEYKPEYCDLIVKMRKSGATVTQFACVINKDTKIIYEWAQRYPEFRSAMSQAKREALSYWIEKGAKAIDSRAPFRENQYRWYMAVCFNLREKQDIQTTNTNINTTAEVSSEELEELKAKVRQAAKDAAEFS